MIIIPYRKDSAQREKNLGGLKFLLGAEEIDYKVIESNASQDVFHKTKLINDGIREYGDDEFTVVWDCDCRVSLRQVFDCMNAMRTISGVCLGYPYYKFLGVNEHNYDKDYEHIKKNAKKVVDMSPLKLSFGGVCIIKNKIYKDIMENENFRGWGPEDDARVMVVERLGYNIMRDMERPLYHIDHPRPADQGKDNEFKNGWAEFYKMLRMTDAELKSYVKRGYKDELLG